MELMIDINDELVWMLPGKLYAIEQGLEFKEIKYDNCTYRGYFNKDGEEEGVGIMTFNVGEKHSGEYKRGERNGVVKIESIDGDIYWGQFKNGLKEGYGTFQWKLNDRKYTGQYKNGKRNG